jgi:hypothetical protein
MQQKQKPPLEEDEFLIPPGQPGAMVDRLARTVVDPALRTDGTRVIVQLKSTDGIFVVWSIRT